MAELVDAHVSEACERKFMWVRAPSSVLKSMSNVLKLPLSWVTDASIDVPNFEVKVLPFSKKHWVFTARLPSHFNLVNIDSNLSQQGINNWLIRGMNEETLVTINLHPQYALLVGKEAYFDLKYSLTNHSTLKRLVRKGHQKSVFSEAAHNICNQDALINLQKCSKVGNLPLLQYLFLTKWDLPLRCFVMCCKYTSKWLGALLLSPNTIGGWHTELLLRHQAAPQGTMEALIQSTYELLQAEKQSFLSLGEVPFYPPNTPSNYLALSVNAIGKSLNFAYNAKGLEHFKSKFRPQWKKVYLYSNTRIYLTSIIEMFYACGMPVLIYKSLLEKFCVYIEKAKNLFGT